MKKTKLLLFLSAILLALGLVAAHAVAADPAPSLSIEALNLSVENAVHMVFKVADEGVDAADIELLVWETAPAEYKKGTEKTVLTASETEADTGYTVFRYTDLAAKDMTKTVYVCAYARVNGVDVYSAPTKYSIVMYAYLKKNATTPNIELCALLDSMLAYGAEAQKYFHHNESFLATDTVREIKVKNGSLSDGFSLAWVKEGSTVTVTADAPDEGYVFSHWADATGTPVSTDATYTLTATKSETYTAVYKEEGAQDYSEGLEYETNDDGTCYVVGLGDCTDTDIVIPAISPDNDIVIGIDKSAFAGEAITSIALPNTIEEIGRQAFNNCTALTDVYYDGTEDEWNENVTVASGNTAFLNATMHFKMPPVEDEEEYTEPTLVVESVIANVGDDTVDVVISIANNPGISSLKFDVAFDDTLLTLTAVTFDTAFGSYVTAPEPYKNPQTVSFMSPTADLTVSGKMVTLTFTLSDTAIVGATSDITVTIDQSNTFDSDFNDVVLETAHGSVTIR